MMNQPENLPFFLVLASRQQYSSCHVQVSDLDKRLAAIRVGGKYYSFFQAVSDSNQVLDMVIKLTYRGDRVVVTPIAKGYALWVWEPDAIPTARVLHKAIRPTETAPCHVLLSREPHPLISVWVPDLDKPLSAIATNEKYYSLFRVEAGAEKVLDRIAKITQRGDETLLAKVESGFAICVWEPEAYLAKSKVS